MHPVITDFRVIRPSFTLSQEETLEWIAKAHKKAEGEKQNKPNENPEIQLFHEELKSRLYKLGMGKEKIQKRGLEFADFSHLDWEKMEIFSFESALEGANFSKRSALFDTISTKKFEEFYPENAKAPDHLIHVTCTGYVAPSGAQKIISKRGFGKKTIVTRPTIWDVTALCQLFAWVKDFSTQIPLLLLTLISYTRKYAVCT